MNQLILFQMNIIMMIIINNKTIITKYKISFKFKYNLIKNKNSNINI